MNGWTPEITQRERIGNLVVQLSAPDVQFAGRTARDDDEFEANLTTALRQKIDERNEYYAHLAATIDGADFDDRRDAIARRNG